MRYLDQLKNISKVPHGEPKEPKKPPEPGSLGFLGAPPGLFEKIDAGEPANDPTRTACRWRIHFADRNPVEVAFSPAATHAEALASYPDALAAEPATEILRQPDALLTGRQETAVMAWLALIGETDEAIIGDVLRKCRQDEDARGYFLGQPGYTITAGEGADRCTAPD